MKKALIKKPKKELVLIIQEGLEDKKGTKYVANLWTKDWQNASDKSIATIVRMMTYNLKKGIKKDEKRKQTIRKTRMEEI